MTLSQMKLVGVKHTVQLNKVNVFNKYVFVLLPKMERIFSQSVVICVLSFLLFTQLETS